MLLRVRGRHNNVNFLARQTGLEILRLQIFTDIYRLQSNHQRQPSNPPPPRLPGEATSLLIEPDNRLSKIHDHPPGCQKLQHAANKIMWVTSLDPADKYLPVTLECRAVHLCVIRTVLLQTVTRRPTV